MDSQAMDVVEEATSPSAVQKSEKAGVVCAVPSCRRVSGRPGEEDITFHRFPTGLVGRLWLHTCGMKASMDALDYAHICSAHFVPTDFEPATPDQQSGRRQLLNTAFPSRFFDASGQRIAPSTYRAVEQAQFAVVVVPEKSDETMANAEDDVGKEALKCAVPDCPHIRGRPGSKSVSFHPFPRDMRCKVWLVMCGMNTDMDVEDAHMCSAHFKSTDFDLEDVNRQLLDSAIPSVTSFVASYNTIVLDSSTEVRVEKDSEKFVVCVVPGCIHFRGRPESRYISFHSFPGGDLAKIWLDKCGIRNPIRTEMAHICSAHFKSSDFLPTFLRSPLNRQLLVSAVPSRLLPDPSKWNADAETKDKQKEKKPAKVPPLPKPSTRSDCAVSMCRNYRGKPGCEEVSFHSFPKKERQAEVWVHACRRQDEIGKNEHMCSDHFQPSDFYFPKTGLVRRLNKNAVPTRFDCLPLRLRPANARSAPRKEPAVREFGKPIEKKPKPMKFSLKNLSQKAMNDVDSLRESLSDAGKKMDRANNKIAEQEREINLLKSQVDAIVKTKRKLDDILGMDHLAAEAKRIHELGESTSKQVKVMGPSPAQLSKFLDTYLKEFSVPTMLALTSSDATSELPNFLPSAVFDGDDYDYYNAIPLELGSLGTLP